MSLQLTIPESVLRSLPVPDHQREQELLKELAVALYGQELLPFEAARELAQMGACEFGQLLGERCVHRHCGRVSLPPELACAHGE